VFEAWEDSPIFINWESCQLPEASEFFETLVVIDSAYLFGHSTLEGAPFTTNSDALTNSDTGAAKFISYTPVDELSDAIDELESVIYTKTYGDHVLGCFRTNTRGGLTNNKHSEYGVGSMLVSPETSVTSMVIPAEFNLGTNGLGFVVTNSHVDLTPVVHTTPAQYSSYVFETLSPSPTPMFLFDLSGRIHEFWSDNITWMGPQPDGGGFGDPSTGTFDFGGFGEASSNTIDGGMFFSEGASPDGGWFGDPSGSGESDLGSFTPGDTALIDGGIF
jgi:hypothetical protein